jgi:DNA-directed RNA polymerase specialized sigma24 family protein
MALADPSRGRFRTFLQTLANRFLINEWRAERRQKRAGGKTFVPIEIVEGDVADLTSGAGDPDTAFDCDWAQTVITRARNSVLAEYDKRNRRDIADAMLPHVLDTDYDYSKLSTSLGMSVANVRVAAHRIKRRFGDSIRATILETVADPADVDEELKYLISVIAKL